MRFEEV